MLGRFNVQKGWHGLSPKGLGVYLVNAPISINFSPLYKVFAKVQTMPGVLSPPRHRPPRR